jgi:SMODS and SLOG-associating 2TM effector domain 2
MPRSETLESTQPPDRGTGKAVASLARVMAVWMTISLLLIVLWLLAWHFRVGGGWIHFLPVAVLIIVIVLLTKFIPATDIETEQDVIPKWNADKVADSLAEVHSYVIREAGKSIHWYWRAKRSKAFPSQFIRFSAWMLASVGGLLPVVGSLFKISLPGGTELANGLWASLFLGIAAALLGLDKAFGYSSGWARYVLTATNIRRTLEEFRIDWAELMAEAGTSPTAESVAPLIDRAKKFRTDVEVLVLQETKDWVTEFQNSMVQMEKDIVAQVAALKAQVDKAAQAKEAAEQPGSIQLQIQNASKVDAGTTISVCLTDAQGKTIEESASGQSWARLNLLPGQYKIRIKANVKGQNVEDQKVVPVKPGEIADVQLTL